jgi:hypothetical protein
MSVVEGQFLQLGRVSGRSRARSFEIVCLRLTSEPIPVYVGTYVSAAFGFALGFWTSASLIGWVSGFTAAAAPRRFS